MANEVPVQSFLQKRVACIDALRGFDMFWIVGGEGIIRAFFKVWPNAVTGALDAQSHHADWQGFHFYDLIFPLFLFMVGLVLPFSMSRRLEEGANRRQLYGHIVRRLLVLFLLGLLCNGPLDLNLHTLRIPGVLQRIAVCYFLAALVVMNTSIRAQAWVAGGILVVYWVILKLVPVPGFGAGVFTQEGNLAGYIDRLILPQASRCYFFGDNEGVLSTLPAVATRLLGVLAGHWLRSKNSPQRKALGLALGGVSSLLLGLVWGFDFPINKILWTSSYVLTAGGWSLLLLALFYWIIDVRGFERWSFFFKVIGMNAITIYVVHNIYAPNHVHLSGLFANIFLHGIMRYLGPAQPLVWACGVVTTMWLFLYFLYRQKIFLRV